jgi:hypothetical protein
MTMKCLLNLTISSISGCALVAGADHDVGARHSWIKIATMRGTDVQEKMAVDKNFDIKDSCITS